MKDNKKDHSKGMYKKILSGIFWATVVFIVIGVVFCLFALLVLYIQKLKNS